MRYPSDCPEKRHGYYMKNQAANIEKAKVRAAVTNRLRRAWLNSLKGEPCMDCGESFPPCVMQFAHRDRSTKNGNVGQMMNCSVERILTEIAKCDLVCANCHAIRTWIGGQ